MPKEERVLDDGTKLVNLRTADDWDTYIGRQNPHKGLPQSTHHNPYFVEEHGRDGAVANFRVWFYYRLLTEEGYFEQVQNLRGETLACWCLPEFCHGEVIIDFLDNVKNEDEMEEYISKGLVALPTSLLSLEGLEYRARVEENLNMNTNFVEYAELDES